jgi:F0F1-type ATP synthase delta subunit
VAAEVVSAVAARRPRSEGARAALAGGRGRVELTSEVEPGLVGGLVIRMAGRTYDGSVRTRLGRAQAPAGRL